MEFVRWDAEFDGNSITIRNVANLTIEGTGPLPTRLIVKPRYAFVLNFDHCKNVRLSHLTLGHAPELGSCTSGVVGASLCADLTISNCDLFGCGTEGLTLNGVAGLRFEDSEIRNCTYYILTARSCRDLKFSGSQFHDNEEFSGFSFHDTDGIEFDRCSVRHNRFKEPLFGVVSCSPVRFKGGQIRQNVIKALTKATDKVRFVGTDIGDNRSPGNDEW